MDATLGPDELFNTYIGDTHLANGATAWAGSVLKGNNLVTSTEYTDKLRVTLSYEGEIANPEALFGVAMLSNKGDVLAPILAWKSEETIVLFYDAPADAELAPAFADEGGVAFTLVAG